MIDNKNKYQIENTQMSIKVSMAWEAVFGLLVAAYFIFAFMSIFMFSRAKHDIYAQLFIGSVLGYLVIYFSYRVYHAFQSSRGKEVRFPRIMIFVLLIIVLISAGSFWAMSLIDKGIL